MLISFHVENAQAKAKWPWRELGSIDRVLEGTTVRDLKTRVHQEWENAHRGLFWNKSQTYFILSTTGDILSDDSRVLTFCGITEDVSILVLKRSDAPIDYTINLLVPVSAQEQQLLTVPITVPGYGIPAFSVKRICELQTGIPRTDWRIIFAGKQFEDWTRLLDFGCQKNSKLHAVLRTELRPRR